MNTDEKDIVDYLKGWPNSFVSGKEIARKVGGRERYEDDRGWALSTLAQMVRHGILETDHFGYFKLKLLTKKNRKQKYISPQILNILKSSGKSFDQVTLEIDADLDESDIPAYPKPLTPSAEKPK